MGGLYFYEVFGIGQADPRKTANMPTSSGLALSLLYTSFVCMSTILAGQREVLPRNRQKWSSNTLFNTQLFLGASLIIICCKIPKGFIGNDEQKHLLYSFQEYIESKVDVFRVFFFFVFFKSPTISIESREQRSDLTPRTDEEPSSKLVYN